MEDFANWLYASLLFSLGVSVAAAVLLALGFIWYTQRKNMLTPDGAWLAAATGLWVWYAAGFLWLIPLVVFFVSSSLLGRLSKHRPAAADARHGQPRNSWQVLCNGGIYMLLATWADGPHRETALTLMALSISVSAADTWSSEIGQYFRQKTIDILRWKPVPVGLSGGVSGMGMLGGMAGAALIAGLCGLLAAGTISPVQIAALACGGFAGMMLDSVLGAAFQARYRNPETGALFDQAGRGRDLYSGFSWMTNDAVNLWSNALVTLAGYCLL